MMNNNSDIKNMTTVELEREIYAINDLLYRLSENIMLMLNERMELENERHISRIIDLCNTGK